MSYPQGYGYDQAGQAGQQYGYQGYAAPQQAAPPTQQGAYGAPQQGYEAQQVYPSPTDAYASQQQAYGAQQAYQPASPQQQYSQGTYGSSPPTPTYSVPAAAPQHQFQAYGGSGAQTQQQHPLGAPAPANGMTVAPPLNYPPAPFHKGRKSSLSGRPPLLSSSSSGAYGYDATSGSYQGQSGQGQWGGQAQPQYPPAQY